MLPLGKPPLQRIQHVNPRVDEVRNKRTNGAIVVMHHIYPETVHQFDEPLHTRLKKLP